MIDDQEKTQVFSEMPESIEQEDTQKEREKLANSLENLSEIKLPNFQEENLLLQQQIEELSKRLEESHTDMLRAQADAQNIEKRCQAEITKIRTYSHDKFAQDLLCVLDSLEMALITEKQTLESLQEGVRLSSKQMSHTLERWKVNLIEAEGKAFNPHLHQAMSLVENNDFPPNTVIQVLQSGYMIADRVLRPACVIVSKTVTNLNNSSTSE